MVEESNRCRYTFADGRQCKMPMPEDDMGLCYFHAQKYADRLKGKEAGLRIAKFLNTGVLTASDFNSAVVALFSATALGYMKPKTAATLGYLAQIMLKTQFLAKEEFLAAFNAPWGQVVQQSATFHPAAAISPEPESNPDSPYAPEPLPPISAEPPSPAQPELPNPEPPPTTVMLEASVQISTTPRPWSVPIFDT